MGRPITAQVVKKRCFWVNIYPMLRVHNKQSVLCMCLYIIYSIYLYMYRIIFIYVLFKWQKTAHAVPHFIIQVCRSTCFVMWKHNLLYMWRKKKITLTHLLNMKHCANRPSARVFWKPTKPLTNTVTMLQLPTGTLNQCLLGFKEKQQCLMVKCGDVCIWVKAAVLWLKQPLQSQWWLTDDNSAPYDSEYSKSFTGSLCCMAAIWNRSPSSLLLPLKGSLCSPWPETPLNLIKCSAKT